MLVACWMSLLIYGTENVSTGASNDIQQATSMARRMVTEWGMSDKLGRLRYVDNQEEVFLGHSVSRSQTISGAPAQLIDEENRSGGGRQGEEGGRTGRTRG